MDCTWCERDSCNHHMEPSSLHIERTSVSTRTLQIVYTRLTLVFRSPVVDFDHRRQPRNYHAIRRGCRCNDHVVVCTGHCGEQEIPSDSTTTVFSARILPVERRVLADTNKTHTCVNRFTVDRVVPDAARALPDQLSRMNGLI